MSSTVRALVSGTSTTTDYIDYRLGYGPAILGHCHPEVDAAAREGQEVGTVFALGTEKRGRWSPS